MQVHTYVQCTLQSPTDYSIGTPKYPTLYVPQDYSIGTPKYPTLYVRTYVHRRNFVWDSTHQSNPVIMWVAAVCNVGLDITKWLYCCVMQHTPHHTTPHHTTPHHIEHAHTHTRICWHRHLQQLLSQQLTNYVPRRHACYGIVHMYICTYVHPSIPFVWIVCIEVLQFLQSKWLPAHALVDQLHQQ